MAMQERMTGPERRDGHRDGSDTPSSGCPITRKQDRMIRADHVKQSGKKQGGQPGHKGKSPKAAIDEKKEHVLDKYTHCGRETVPNVDITNFTIPILVHDQPVHFIQPNDIFALGGETTASKI